MTGSPLSRALQSRRVRAWLAAAGITTSTVLVLVLGAAFRGVEGAMDSYAGRRDVDLWVAPRGTDNLIRGSFATLIPEEALAVIRGLDGVAAADPIIKAFLPVTPSHSEGAARRATLLVIGYRSPDGLGGPPSVADGAPPHGRHQVALDRAAAHRLGIHVGDTVAVANRRAVVVGLTRGTNILATQFVFADLAVTAGTAAEASGVSFALVQLASGVDPAAMARTITQHVPDVSVYSRGAFLAANRREVMAGFVPLVTLVAGLGIAAAAVLVGLLVNSVVEDRRTDIAVLLALGADAPSIARGVLQHVLALVVVGVLLGTFLAAALGWVLDGAVPMIPLSLQPTDVLRVCAIFIAVGALAGAIPVVNLRTVDPLEAFRP